VGNGPDPDPGEEGKKERNVVDSLSSALCAVAGKEASRLQQVKIRTSFCSEMGQLVFSAGFPSTPTKVIYQNLHVSQVANIVTVHFPC
jgi:hypothetical protein